ALVNELVTIAAGTTSSTVTVVVSHDDKVEYDEEFTATLWAPQVDGQTEASKVVLSGTAATGTGTLVKDDVATASMTAGVSHPEGTGAGTTAYVFTVSLDKPIDHDVTVLVTAADGMDTHSLHAALQFSALVNELATIAAGTTSS